MRQPINPDRSLGALISELSRLLSRNFNDRVRQHGLTEPQWRALAILSRREGMRQTELAELLNVQPISLGRLIDRLESAGWVERRPDPNDRRAIQLYLTLKAEPILEEMSAAAAASHEAAFTDFDETQREQLFELLNRMKTNLRDSVSTTPAVTVATRREVQQ